MAWLSNNWILILLGAAFIALHLFGHGGHGGHGGHNRQAGKGPAPDVGKGKADADADEASRDAPPAHDRHGG
jgi:hypothetical protein